MASFESGELTIPVILHVLMRMPTLITANLNRLEPPLRQHRVRSPQVTPQPLMAKPQARRRAANPLRTCLLSLRNNHRRLHLPIVVPFSDAGVTVTRDFEVELGNGRIDSV